MASTGIIVEPHMVERVAPAFYDAVNRESRSERRYTEQRGWTARRGSREAWSTSKDAACVMLGFMEGASASQGVEGNG